MTAAGSSRRDNAPPSAPAMPPRTPGVAGVRGQKAVRIFSPDAAGGGGGGNATGAVRVAPAGPVGGAGLVLLSPTSAAVAAPSTAGGPSGRPRALGPPQVRGQLQQAHTVLKLSCMGADSVAHRHRHQRPARPATEQRTNPYSPPPPPPSRHRGACHCSARPWPSRRLPPLRAHSALQVCRSSPGCSSLLTGNAFIGSTDCGPGAGSGTGLSAPSLTAYRVV